MMRQLRYNLLEAALLTALYVVVVDLANSSLVQFLLNYFALAVVAVIRNVVDMDYGN
jgi:hypothetical protein